MKFPMKRAAVVGVLVVGIALSACMK